MNQTTKLILGIIVLALIIWGITSLSGSEPAQGESIKVGAILPLSGSLAYLGEEVRNGISLALEDSNSKNIEVIYEDSKMDPKEGVSVINKLKDVDNTKYIIVWGTPVISAVQPITEENNIVLVGGSISPQILKDKKYTLRIFYNLEQATNRFLKFINDKGLSKVAALYQNSEAQERQIQALEEGGINFIAKEKFNKDEIDFRTQLIKIKSSKPDLIVLSGYGNHFPMIFKQIREMEINEIPILGGLDFLEIPNKEETELYEGAVFLVPEFNLSSSQKSVEFIKKFEESFGYKPSHQAAYAYDAFSLLAGAVDDSGLDTNKAMEFLKKQDKFDGMVGEIEILPNGDSKNSLSFAVYKDGKIERYEEK